MTEDEVRTLGKLVAQLVLEANEQGMSIVEIDLDTARLSNVSDEVSPTAFRPDSVPADLPAHSVALALPDDLGLRPLTERSTAPRSSQVPNSAAALADHRASL
jgi:hypothetical protein